MPATAHPYKGKAWDGTRPGNNIEATDRPGMLNRPNPRAGLPLELAYP